MIKHVLHGSGVAGALVAAFLLGSVTLGGAFAQGPSPQTSPPATAQAGSDQQDQQPSYASSIQVPQNQPGQNEHDEAAALQSQAKITADQAKTAALAQFPGATVHAVALENENGSLVYSVQLTDAAGKAQDVKVDAGNARVLHVEAGGPGGHEAGDGAKAAGGED